MRSGAGRPVDTGAAAVTGAVAVSTGLAEASTSIAAPMSSTGGTIRRIGEARGTTMQTCSRSLVAPIARAPASPPAQVSAPVLPLGKGWGREQGGQRSRSRSTRRRQGASRQSPSRASGSGCRQCESRQPSSFQSRKFQVCCGRASRRRRTPGCGGPGRGLPWWW